LAGLACSSRAAGSSQFLLLLLLLAMVHLQQQHHKRVPVWVRLRCCITGCLSKPRRVAVAEQQCPELMILSLLLLLLLELASHQGLY
jgi:hypothetical protein